MNERFIVADENPQSQVYEVVTDEQINSLRLFRLAAIGPDWPTYSKVVKHAREVTSAPLLISLAATGTDMQPYLDILQKKNVVSGEPRSHTDEVEQAITCHYIALGETFALGKLVSGEELDFGLLKSWHNHDEIAFKGRPTARKLIGKLSTRFLDPETGIERYFALKSAAQPPEVFEASDAVTRQLEIWAKDKLMLSGVVGLTNLSEKAKRQLQVDIALKDWDRQLSVADSETNGEAKAEILNEVFESVMQKVAAVVNRPKKYAEEHTFEMLTVLSSLSVAWIEETQERREFVDDVYSRLASGELFNVGSEDNESSDLDETQEADDQVIEQVALTPVEPEAPYNTEELAQLNEHLTLLTTKTLELQRAWFNKAELKAGGFHDLTAVLRNGGEGHDWKLQPMPNQATVWEVAGLLMHSMQLLEAGSLDEARQVLYDDRNREQAVVYDMSRIATFLKAQGITAETSMPSTATIQASLDLLRADWDNYQGALLEKWPNNRLNTNLLKALLFEEYRPTEVSNEPETKPQDIIVVHEDIASQTEPELDFIPEAKLTEVARQLDWVVFPNGSLDEIRQSIGEHYPHKYVSTIDWRRITDLVTISEAFDGTMYRSKDRTLGNTMPYFVVECEIEGKRFAIAENPQYGNATYIVREDIAAGDWQEILELKRQEASILGAHQVIHPKSDAADQHLTRIYNKLQDLLTVINA